MKLDKSEAEYALGQYRLFHVPITQRLSLRGAIDGTVGVFQNGRSVADETYASLDDFKRAYGLAAPPLPNTWTPVEELRTVYRHSTADEQIAASVTTALELCTGAAKRGGPYVYWTSTASELIVLTVASGLRNLGYVVDDRAASTLKISGWAD